MVNLGGTQKSRLLKKTETVLYRGTHLCSLACEGSSAIECAWTAGYRRGLERIIITTGFMQEMACDGKPGSLGGTQKV